MRCNVWNSCLQPLCLAAKAQCKYCTVMAFVCHCHHSQTRRQLHTAMVTTLQSQKALTGCAHCTACCMSYTLKWYVKRYILQNQSTTNLFHYFFCKQNFSQVFWFQLFYVKDSKLNVIGYCTVVWSKTRNLMTLIWSLWNCDTFLTFKDYIINLINRENNMQMNQ